MMKTLFQEIKYSVIGILSLGILLCGIYPLVTWTVAQVFFHEKANGSLLMEENQIIGSALLAQGFTGHQYFHPRPSAAGGGYDAVSSGGSNLGPLSRTLSEMVQKRVDEYRKENGLDADIPVPADAVTSSGSGLDPHISPENALIQAKRVARERGMTDKAMLQKIADHTEGRTLWLFGQPRVNVLTLNCALDGRL
ncbi:MAG: K(+)-transporting ATPase subunit C [Syntrophorhabdaceae bacterium]|nr:K(+)-transporting ATPase subunit C [Syntrophorhabdaceae bacterium]